MASSTRSLGTAFPPLETIDNSAFYGYHLILPLKPRGFEPLTWSVARATKNYADIALVQPVLKFKLSQLVKLTLDYSSSSA